MTANLEMTSLQGNPDHRLITEARAQDIWHRIRDLPRGDGELVVGITAWWRGELRWARNQVTLASDRRELSVTIVRRDKIGEALVSTNQTDDASLAAALHAAERKLKYGGDGFVRDYDGMSWMPPSLPFPDTHIWSDATFHVTAAQRGELARTLAERSKTEALLSAGFIQMRVGEQCGFGTPDLDNARLEVPPEQNLNGAGASRTARIGIYVRHTEAQCSMTVRHPKGLGSGWAGISGYDWSVLDATSVAERAFDKCQSSLNPVAVEPGRYTVILEPQAVAGLLDAMIGHLQNRVYNERFTGPFTLGNDATLGVRRTKLGLKVVDERITVSHQPMDERLGVLPTPGLTPVTWIDKGILTALSYTRGSSSDNYAIPILTQNLPITKRGSYQMSGGNSTIDEMIAATERGVLVSRLFGMESLDTVSLLMTGVTRDGLWLIENGKISKAIKNMRWTDSPLFVLNQIEMLGVPVPVFRPGNSYLAPAIVPSIKSRDFAFTSTIDAI